MVLSKSLRRGLYWAAPRSHPGVSPISRSGRHFVTQWTSVAWCPAVELKENALTLFRELA